MRWPFRTHPSDDDPAAGLVSAEPAANEASSPREKRDSWELEPGAAIADGRTVFKALGGGSRYEVYLVWDDRLHDATATETRTGAREATATQADSTATGTAQGATTVTDTATHAPAPAGTTTGGATDTGTDATTG